MIVVSDDAVTVSSGDRARFRGQAGTYRWTDVSLYEDQATLSWSVTAGPTKCRVDWSLWGDDGSQSVGTMWAAAGEKGSGSKRVGTSFASGELAFRSSCPIWVAALAGYVPPPPTPKPISAGGSCHPSYQWECLKVGIGDYDCAGGSGNGPNYVVGPVKVVGYDEFDLDRDGDGIGCENG